MSHSYFKVKSDILNRNWIYWDLFRTRGIKCPETPDYVFKIDFKKSSFLKVEKLFLEEFKKFFDVFLVILLKILFYILYVIWIQDGEKIWRGLSIFYGTGSKIRCECQFWPSWQGLRSGIQTMEPKILGRSIKLGRVWSSVIAFQLLVNEVRILKI